MKDYFKLIVLVCVLAFQNPISAKAQGSGLFSNKPQPVENRGDENDDPNTGGEPTPIGSGLLVLTGLSLGYACFKHSRNEDWIIFSPYT